MKSKIRIFMISASLLAMSGCGGGGDTGNNNQTQTAVLSGKVADGYIRGATVCLDKNRNKRCDAGEPSTISGAGGAYDLEVTAADQASYPIIAEVGIDAIDEDNPGQTVANDYVLTTPPGKHAVVSPLTTMINNELEKNPVIGTDGAESSIKQKLGYSSDDDVSLYADYVAESQNTGNANQAEYERLHNVAKVVAKAVADNKDSVEAALAGTQYTLDEVLDEVIDIIVARVIEGLGNIAVAVDADPNAIDAIAATVPAGTSNGTVEDDIAAQRAKSDSTIPTAADMAEFYFLDITNLASVANASTVRKYNIADGVMSVWLYNWNGAGAYIEVGPLGTAVYEGPDRTLTDSGWKVSTATTVQMMDGVLSFQIKDASNNILASEDYLIAMQDMSGKRILDFTNAYKDLYTYTAYLDGSEILPAGSRSMSIQRQQQIDLFQYFSSYPAIPAITSVDGLVSVGDAIGDHDYFFCNANGDCSGYKYEIIGIPGENSGEVKFYTDDNGDSVYDVYSVSGTWSKSVIGGVSVLKVKPPQEIDWGANGGYPEYPAFANNGSEVFSLYYVPAGAITGVFPAMNKVMVDAIALDAGFTALP